MFLTATRIHDGHKWLPEGTVLEVGIDGSVLAMHESHPQAKHFDGVICPGFVNVHCHVELSHMKGKIPEHTGLIPFLKQVNFTRHDFTEEQKTIARHEAFKYMQANGIVAVGDICNTNDTADLRESGNMHFHSFVESIGFSPNPQRQFDFAVNTYHNFSAQSSHKKLLRQSIVPHAPYSVSQQLFSIIDKHDELSLLCIHNQESRAEDEYYLIKQGAVNDLLDTIGIDHSFFQPSGKSSIQTYLQWLSVLHPVIFVHNTYTTSNDVEVAQTLLKHVYWCLCPNANLYIENTLPDIPMLLQKHAHICIGTDSLSSNHQLSVLAELQTIKAHHADIDWEVLLQWGTLNGAQALQMDTLIGSIEVGKKPGLVLLSPDMNEVLEVLA